MATVWGLLVLLSVKSLYHGLYSSQGKLLKSMIGKALLGFSIYLIYFGTKSPNEENQLESTWIELDYSSLHDMTCCDPDASIYWSREVIHPFSHNVGQMGSYSSLLNNNFVSFPSVEKNRANYRCPLLCFPLKTIFFVMLTNALNCHKEDIATHTSTLKSNPSQKPQARWPPILLLLEKYIKYKICKFRISQIC